MALIRHISFILKQAVFFLWGYKRQTEPALFGALQMIPGLLTVTDYNFVGIITCSATSEKRNALIVTRHLKLLLVPACCALNFRFLALCVKDNDSIYNNIVKYLRFICGMLLLKCVIAVQLAY